MIGQASEEIEYISLKKDLITTQAYMYAATNPWVVSSIEFQVSDDLYMQQVETPLFLDVLAQIGGLFILLKVVFAFIFSLLVPASMYLDLIKELFKVEPASEKFKKPKSIEKLQSIPPEVVLRKARDVMKRRSTITENRCEKFVLLFESLVTHLACGRTRMARILADGVDQVTAELDVGRHLKKMRFY